MCEVVRKGFPSILRDNDELFLSKLTGIIESVDELAAIEILKTTHCWHFRVAPSTSLYLEPTLKEILNFVNLFGIHLELGKSMKNSSTISFNIEI